MREKMRVGDTAVVSNPGQKKRATGGRKANVIRVLVAEDHTVVRDGLVAIIKQEAHKDVRREELFQCIREVHAGRTFLPPAVAAKLAERLPAEELTPPELDVLRLLAEGKPNKLIGADLAITEVTVKSHVQSVFRKLNVLSRTEAIAVANRRGLLHL